MLHGRPCCALKTPSRGGQARHAGSHFQWCGAADPVRGGGARQLCPRGAGRGVLGGCHPWGAGNPPAQLGAGTEVIPRTPAQGPARRTDGHPGAVCRPRREPEPRQVPARRPVPGHYIFSVDVDCGIRDARVAGVLRSLHQVSPKMRFLGFYPRGGPATAVHPGAQRRGCL